MRRTGWRATAVDGAPSAPLDRELTRLTKGSARALSVRPACTLLLSLLALPCVAVGGEPATRPAGAWSWGAAPGAAARVVRRQPFPAGLRVEPGSAARVSSARLARGAATATPTDQGDVGAPPPVPAARQSSGTGARRPGRPADGVPHEVWGFVLDQDMFFPPFNEDRDYTQGVGVEWFREWPGAAEPLPWVGPVHTWLDELSGRFGLDADTPGREVTSWGLAALAYTPDDLRVRAVIPDDRPYASVISVGWKRVTLTPDVVVGSELRLGALGTKVAEEVQGAIHAAFRTAGGGSDVPRDPKGWSNQISDGGELTMLYRVSSDRRLGGDPGRWDLHLLRDVSLGYRTDVAAGLGFRTGQLVNGWEAAPVEPLFRANHVPSLAEGDSFFWGAARVRLVAYDALLQGQFRDSALEVSAGDVKRAVVHAGAGFTLTPWPGWQLSYGAHARSHEAADPDRWHFWGGVTLQGRS